MSAPALVILAAGLGTRFGGIKQLAPVGPNGEPIMDYAARDAGAAGFGQVVLIVRSEIEAQVAEHVSGWPSTVDVRLVCQDREPSAVAAAAAGRSRPLGTAHAVVCAAPWLTGPFAVVNADDLYGADPYVALSAHFNASDNDALVVFEVAKTITGDKPVTRALCKVDGGGLLGGIDEGTVTALGGLKWVSRSGDKAQETALTGREPVSMNFWGFRRDMLGVMERAVARFMSRGGADTDDEVLLPDVVREQLGARQFSALPTGNHCLGITHADDLALLRAAVPDPAW